MKILMCRPDYYAIKYEINPWMRLEQQAHHDVALSQWDTLYQCIRDCGAEVLLISPQPDCPDMTFTANAGMLYKGSIVLSHFKFIERQIEAPYFEIWFRDAGFKIENQVAAQKDTPYFEGAGDALPAGDILFCGYGFRTQRSFYQNTIRFNQDKLVYCELVDPYFYHLDTCFCPLNESLAIWYKDAFSPQAQQDMQNHIKLLNVAPEEAKHFACNAVVIDQHVILPAACEKIGKILTQEGFKVHHCAMTEYLKAGGACKCLTLRLD